LFLDGEHLLGFATVFLTSLDGSSTSSPFEVVGDPLGTFYSNDQPLLIDGAELGPGPALLSVTRSDGLESNQIEILIQGAAPPVITRVTPDPLRLSAEMIISIYGTGFWGPPEVSVSPDVPTFEWISLPLVLASDTWLRTDSLTFDPVTTPSGNWVMRVTNPDGVESEYFSINFEPAPPPTLTNLSPVEAPLRSDVAIELFGYDIFGLPTLLMAPEPAPGDPVGEPLPPVPLDLVDPHRVVTVTFTLSSPPFEPRPYLVWITNPDGSLSNRLRFQVLE